MAANLDLSFYPGLADLRAYGTVTLVCGKMVGHDWTIEVIEPLTDKRIALLGYGTPRRSKIALNGHSLK